MGVGAGLYVYVVVVQKFTFAISSPDEFLFTYASRQADRLVDTHFSLQNFISRHLRVVHTVRCGVSVNVVTDLLKNRLTYNGNARIVWTAL